MTKTGRPFDSVKHRYQQILESSGAYARLQRILKQTENEQNFLKALEMAEDRAYGKPVQRNENLNRDINSKIPDDVLDRAIARSEAIVGDNESGEEMETIQ